MPNLGYVIFGAIVVAGLIFLIAKAGWLNTDEFPVDRVRLVELVNQWHGPSELVSFPPPRPVQFTGQAKALLGFLAVAFAGISAVFLFVALPSMQLQELRDSLVSKEGLLSQGTVTRAWITRDKSSRSYHVSYQYEVDGIIHHSEAQVGANTYFRLESNPRLTLRYAPSHPELSKLDGEIERPRWLIFLMVLPFAAVGVLPYLILKQKKLLERGQPVGAVVTRVAPVKGGRSVSYKFLDFAGNTIKGSVTMKSSVAPPVGNTVTVIFDPENSHSNMLYPASFVRLRSPSRP